MDQTQEEEEDKTLRPVTGEIDLPQGVVKACPAGTEGEPEWVVPGLLRHLKLQDPPFKEEVQPVIHPIEMQGVGLYQLVRVGGKVMETTHHLQEVLVDNIIFHQ